MKSPISCVVAKDWSRTTRKALELLTFDQNQTKVTEYFPLQDRVDEIFKNDNFPHTFKSKIPEKAHFSTRLFQELVANADENLKRNATQRKHNEIIKKFSISVLFMAGPSAYELLHKNMPLALPSLSTVKREIHKSFIEISEGSFQFDQLVDHLNAYSAAKVICISEDATRVVSRVEYDSNTDRLVGFVLPVDENCIPVQNAFCASSFERIEEIFMKESKASYAYLYMAQALSSGVPPFCLALIGSDNHFTNKTVVSRWKYIVTQCKLRDIHVIGASADGDSRLLSAMRLASKLHSVKTDLEFNVGQVLTQSSIPTAWSKWFALKEFRDIVFVQDTVHLAVKLKSRLLTHSQILPLGSYSAESSHLSMLQVSFQKEQHNLRSRDLDHQDRQNFEAILRITDNKVLNLLSEFADAKGTKYYLNATKSIMESYMNKTLTPLQRIEKAWYALFFFRYWRQWVLSQKEYSTDSNFISNNSYVCIELNAHALIALLIILRDHLPDLSSKCYAPWLLSSQPCEQTFRSARSMSNVFSTIVNFEVLGLLRRLHRLQIQLDLESKSNTTKIIYPRQLAHQKIEEKTSEFFPVNSVTNAEIEGVVKKGLIQAKEAMEDLGMKDDLVKIKQWEIVIGDVSNDLEVNDGEDIVEVDEVDSKEVEIKNLRMDQVIDDVFLMIPPKEVSKTVDTLTLLEEKEVIKKGVKQKFTTITRQANTQDNEISYLPLYKDSDDPIDICRSTKLDKKFVQINHKGEVIYIRKTTLVWLFQENERVSNDRLFRVRAQQPYTNSHQIIASHCNESEKPTVKSSVSLGDICVFMNDSKSLEPWAVGKITQFAFHKQKSKKDRQYKKSEAPVESSVGVLCSWFKKDTNKFLLNLVPGGKSSYIPLEQSYICTLSLGCMKDVKSTDIDVSSIRQVPLVSKLYTASEFSLDHESFEVINLFLTEKKQKLHPSNLQNRQKSKSKSEVIDLTDDDDSEVCERLWISCEGYRLSMKEKQLIENGGQLTDRIINASCAILKKQFPMYGGLQTTLLQQSGKGLTSNDSAIQIIHLPDRNHWAAISTIDCDSNNVKYYDSLFKDTSVQTVQTIVSLLKPSKSINAQIMDVLPQKGAADCGLYCIAYCVSLAYKVDPCLFVYNQIEMRLHLMTCLEKGHLTEFPVLRKRRLSNNCRSSVTLFVCPVCLKPDDGELMIFCEQCKEWFHKNECVPQHNEISEELEIDWFCENCRLST